MAIAYYGVTLPDKHNWVETPEKYLVFKNAVIGRTGFQTYKGYELDAGELQEQDIVVADDDDVELFRDPEEVFSPKTLASFVGKSVTDGHPSELLSIENVSAHEQGQVLNVRRGNDALESGDYPLLADLIVKSKDLIDKIKSGLRELSCGYNYHVLKDGNLIKQVDIIGNHVAVVENARAGREAVIVDSTPITSIERFDYMNFLETIFNTNRKSKIAAWAKDAKPEEIAEAFDKLGTALETRPEVTTTVVVKPKKAAKATDATDAVDRKRFHDALDRYFDGAEQEEAAKDADVEELKKMFRGGNDSAVDEAADEGKDEEEEEEEKKEKEGEDEEKEGEDEAGALTIEPSDRPQPAGPGTDAAAIHAARVEGATAVLRTLKPIIAQSGNKKVIAAYDTVARTVQGKSVGKTSGGYGKFAEAAQKRGKEAQDSVDASKNTNLASISAFEDLYAKRFASRQ